MIQTIQNQVAIARQVLAAAESQASMSEQELNAVKEQIAAAQSEVEAAGSEESEALEELRKVESSIVRKQKPDSPLGKAQAMIDEAEQALHREIHRVVSLPEHATTSKPADRLADVPLLSADDRESLRNDEKYQAALKSLATAKRDFAKVRQDVLKQSSEWVAASQSLAEAHKEESRLKRKANVGTVRSLPAKKNLRTAQEVAAAARATIVQGEAMLRQLGVKDVGGTVLQAQANGSKPKK